MIRMLDRAVEAIGLGDRMHMQGSVVARSAFGLAIPLFAMLVCARWAFGVPGGEGTDALTLAQALAAGGVAPSPLALRLALCAGAFAVGLLATVLPKERMGFFSSTRAAVLTLVALGVALLALWATSQAVGLGAVPGGPLLVAQVVLAALTGALLCSTLLHWATTYTRYYVSDIITLALLACGIAVVAYGAYTGWLPIWAGLPICAPLCLLDAYLLRRSLLDQPASANLLEIKTIHARRSEWSTFLQKVTIPLLCLGIVLRVFLGHLLLVAQAPGDPFRLAFMALMLLVVMVIISFGVYGVRHFGQPFANFIAFLLPLVALLSVPMSTLDALQGEPPSPAVGTALCVLMALCWSFMGNASLEYLLHSSSLFGLSIASLTLGLVLGEPVENLVLGGSDAGWLIMSLLCILMAVGFLPPRTPPNLTRSRGFGAMPSANAQACPVYKGSPDTVPSSCPMAIAARESAASAKTGPVQRGAAQRGDDSTASASARAAAPRQAAGGSDLGAGLGQAAGGPKQADTDSRKADADPLLAHKSDSDDGKHRQGRFVRRCMAVAELYQLSNRETEVLVLLGKGRSMSFIEEELVISEGTAKTHINHVYKKLDVHSRNELIDLIENTPVDDAW